MISLAKDIEKKDNHRTQAGISTETDKNEKESTFMNYSLM